MVATFMAPSRVETPWGWWEVVFEDASIPVKVKRLHIKAGHRTSLQTHPARIEHVIPYAGRGMITMDQKTYAAKPGSGTFIDPMFPHRLEGQAPHGLTCIEVQYGYTPTGCDEESIQRIEDDYGRS